MRVLMFILGTVGLLVLFAINGTQLMLGEGHSSSHLNMISLVGICFCSIAWLFILFRLKSPSENAGLLEVISESVFIIDCNSRNIVCVNKATTDLLEFQREDLLYRPASHLFAGNETTVDKLLAFDNPNITDPLILTVAAMRKNGSLITMQLTSRPVQYHNSDCVMINGSDITEKVKASEDQARLASILESNISGLCAANREGIITNWNKAATRILGYRAKEMIGKPFMILVRESNRKQRWEWYKHLLKGSVLPAYESEVIHKDGRSVCLQIDASPIRNEKGEITGASVLFRDIEKDRNAEQKNKKNAQHLEVALKAARLGLWEYDCVSNTFTVISEPEENSFGYEPDTTLSYPRATGLIHPLDRQQSELEFQYVLKSKTDSSLSIKARIQIPNGLYRWTLVAGQVAERDEDGFPAKIILVQQDISKEMAEKQREESERIRIKTLLAWSERTDASRKDILDFTLQKAVELTGSYFGLIGQVDKINNKITLSWPAPNRWPQGSGTLPPQKIENPQFEISGSALWTKAIHTGEPVVSNTPNLMEEDQYFFGEHDPIERYMSVPILDEGQVAGMVLVANKDEGYATHDVIELQLLAQGMWNHIRKIESENARKKAELEKNIILDNLQEGVLCIADDQRITYANRSACEIFGKPIEEIVGHAYDETCPSATHCEITCIMHDVIETKHPCHQEITTDEGNRYDMKVCPVCDEQGEIFRVIETFCAVASGTSSMTHQRDTAL